MAKSKGRRAALNEMAAQLLKYISSFDPTWAARIEIMRAERAMDDLQIAANTMAVVLERAEHMTVPDNPYFQDDFGSAYDERPCKWCEKPFMPEYPGQPLCSNSCAINFYRVNPVSA